MYTEATTEYEYKLPADISVMITVTAKRSVVVKEVSKDYFVMANSEYKFSIFFWVIIF